MPFGGAVKGIKKRTGGASKKISGGAGGLTAGVVGGFKGGLGFNVLAAGFEDITGARNLKKAQKAQKQANLLERRRAKLEQTRQIRETLNQARIQKAQFVAQQFAGGEGTGSSAFQGAESIIGTQAAETVGQAQQGFGFASLIQQYESKAAAQRAKAGGKQSTFQTVLNIGTSLAGL